MHVSSLTGLLGLLDHLRTWNSGINKGLAACLPEFGTGKEFLKCPGYISGTARCRIVTHVAYEIRLLVTLYGLFQHLLQGCRRSHELETVAY